MTETVHRFMNARDLMSLVAGNWASLQNELESAEPTESDGLLAVDVSWVRFAADSAAAEADANCRGGIVSIDLAPLVEGEEYQREGDAVYVIADVLVAEPVKIGLKP